MITSEHQVFGNAQPADKTLALTIFGNMGHTQIMSLARIVVRQILAIQHDGSTCGFSQSRKRLDKFGLTIALHASDAHYLPGTNVERHSLNMCSSVCVQHRQVTDIQDHVSSLSNLLIDG